MKLFQSNEEAVSPVIGVILMVAITVVLAAVIAMFVFGMADNVETQKTVGLTSQIANDNITVTIVGGPDLKALTDLSVKLNGTVLPNADELLYLNGDEVKAGTNDNFDGTWIHHADSKKFSAGDVITIKGKTVGQIVIAGTFSDNTEQALLQKTFN